MTQRPFHAVYAAETGVLELGHFAAAGDRRLALSHEGLVHHSLDDDRPGGVVRARFGAEPQELHAHRIDIVLVDQADDGGRRQGIDAVVRPPYAEAASDYLAYFRPVITGPFAPIVEPHPKRGHVSG